MTNGFDDVGVLDNGARELQDSVARFVAQRCNFTTFRQRQAQDAGLDRALWSQFGEMGWLGVMCPESVGGMNQSFTEACQIVEAMAGQFVIEPYQQALAAMHVLATLGTPAQQQRWLPGACAGERVLLLAHAEAGARYDLHCVQTRAQEVEGGFRLQGTKCAIPCGDAADLLIVSARTSGGIGDAHGISLFALDMAQHASRVTRHVAFNGDPCADVQLDGLVVPHASLLGAKGQASAVILAAHQLLLVMSCVDAAGTLHSVLDATRAYANMRRQFGQPLSRFQVIAHRLVDMFVQVELARSMAWMGVEAHSPQADPRRDLRLSAAKAMVSTACRQVGEAAVQIHGGIGMTDELALSHQVRRLLAIERQLGDRFHHLGVLSHAVARGDGLYTAVEMDA